MPWIKQTAMVAYQTSFACILSLLCVSPAAAQMVPPALQSSRPMLPSRTEAKRAVVRCGLSINRVSVRYEPDMQEDVVWVAADRKQLSESILKCVARASLTTTYFVYFRDRGEQQHYWRIYGEINDEAELASARSWLRQRNLISTAPIPIMGKPLADFTMAVESFCGVKPRSLLDPGGDERMITFAQGGLDLMADRGAKNAAVAAEQFKCVMSVMASAELKRRGIFFGFTGNTAARSR